MRFSVDESSMLLLQMISQTKRDLKRRRASKQGREEGKVSFDALEREEVRKQPKRRGTRELTVGSSHGRAPDLLLVRL